MAGRWSSFWYNFAWPDYVRELDGWVARASLAIPLVGYLILFNDTIAGYLTSFDILAGPRPAWSLVDGPARLKALYLGLLALAAANALYRWRRPYLLRWGTSEQDYVSWAMENLTVGDFVRINSHIRSRAPFTQSGKYYSGEWDTFLAMADGERGGPNRPEDFRQVDFAGAKARFGSLLRGMLSEFYFEAVRERRISLIFCLAFARTGYTLLAIPAVDLFLRVLSVII